jgi:hypothetical protein
MKPKEAYVNCINHTPSRRVVGKALAGNALIGLAAATLLANGLPAQAQQTEVEALRAQIEELSQRLEKLETSQVATAEAAKSTPSVTSRSPVTISSLLQVQYNSFANEFGSAFPRQPNSFRLRRGEIRITAPTITPRISGTVMFDVAKFITNSAANPVVSPNNNVLQEIQLSYLLKKATAPSTNNIYADIGQFKIPIGYEGDLVSSGALQTVERALMFRARDVNNGGAGDIRETGAQLRGTLGQFDYRLGVFNGLGERQNQLATGDARAYVARLAFRPKSIEGLMVGVSGGKANLGTNPTGAGLSAVRTDREVLNMFAAYKRDKLTIQTEYLTGEGQNLTAAGAAGTRRDLRGYYGSLGYMFTPKIEGVLRYDFFDFARNRDLETEVKELTAGINYYIKGNNAKIQANIVRVDGGRDLTAANGFGGGSQGQGLRNDRTELRLQGQVSF